MSTEKHGHKHHGKSTRDILDPKRVLGAAGLNESQTFLDAGCGDGFISLEASKVVKDRGKVYALDAYQPSLDTLKKRNQRASNWKYGGCKCGHDIKHPLRG
nr:hypothetical protein [Methanobacterium formicicum]